jgi:hypothetical protein
MDSLSSGPVPVPVIGWRKIKAFGGVWAKRGKLMPTISNQSIIHFFMPVCVFFQHTIKTNAIMVENQGFPLLFALFTLFALKLVPLKCYSMTGAYVVFKTPFNIGL